MWNRTKINVLKFGSSVLRSEKDLPRVVQDIYQACQRGSQVLVVVSAFGNTTDELIGRAENICKHPDQSALAALLATGEATAAALLGLSLTSAGIRARILDPAQAGLYTIGDALDAELIGADVERIQAELQRGVVVLPGFVGRDETGNTTLLGRGGSDLTALFLAQRLGGRCVLFKDVDGLYTSDPARSGYSAQRFTQVSWETALAVGGEVVQPKAVRFAAMHALRFSITAVGAAVATEVGPGPNRLAQSEQAIGKDLEECFA